MQELNLESRMESDLHKRKKTGALRELVVKTDLIDFSSNDYLGLACNHHLIKNVREAYAELTSLGSAGSRLLSGNKVIHEEVEHQLAEIHGAESALLMNSGYVANLAFLSSVPQKGDTIIYDEYIHACVKDGARLSLANRFSFKHNKISDLKKKIEKASGQVFVIVESIYSMDGDEAPIEELVHLSKKNGFHLVVDEAHSTGNYGKNGGGWCLEKGFEKDVFARIHTFGKAIGAHGAVIVGSELLRSFLINNARPFIYTTALPEHQIVSIQIAYEYIAANSYLQGELRNVIKIFKETLHTDTGSNSAIQPVIVPGNEECVSLANRLNEFGYDVRPVRYPTVQKGHERLRICLHSQNKVEDVISLAEQINRFQQSQNH